MNVIKIKEPEDYKELLDAVEGFNKVGITPIAFNVTPEGSFLYQNIVARLGGKEWTENPLDSEGNIRESYVLGLNYLKELYDHGAFSKNDFVQDDISRNRMFADKEAAMIVQGSWFSPTTTDEEEPTYEVIPFPRMPNMRSREKAIIYGIGNGNFHISQSTWNVEEKRMASLELLKFLTSKEAVQILSEHQGFIGSLNVGSKRNTKIESYILSAEEWIGPPDHYIDRSFWEGQLVKQIPLVLEGRIKPEAIFEHYKDER